MNTDIIPLHSYFLIINVDENICRKEVGDVYTSQAFVYNYESHWNRRFALDKPWNQVRQIVPISAKFCL